MIAKLQTQLPDYLGVDHSRFFLHVVNLVAKLIVKQFDKQDAPTAINILQEIDETEDDDDENSEDEDMADDEDGESKVDAKSGNPKDAWVDEHSRVR